jgi:alcohol dehydrogenase class IV
MAYASTLAGIAQSTGGCTIPHALSCPLTVNYGTQHGHAVGICQIPVIEYTKQTIPDRYKEIVDYIEPGAGIPAEEAGDYLIEKIRCLLKSVDILDRLDEELPDDVTLDRLSEEAMADDGVYLSVREVDAAGIKTLYHMIFKA